MNLALILFAAAPETCCEMTPLHKDAKGSWTSAKPPGVNKGHGCFSISGAKRGSIWIRWDRALERILSVEAVAEEDAMGSAIVAVVASFEIKSGTVVAVGTIFRLEAGRVSSSDIGIV